MLRGDIEEYKDGKSGQRKIKGRLKISRRASRRGASYSNKKFIEVIASKKKGEETYVKARQPLPQSGHVRQTPETFSIVVALSLPQVRYEHIPETPILRHGKNTTRALRSPKQVMSLSDSSPKNYGEPRGPQPADRE